MGCWDTPQNNTECKRHFAFHRISHATRLKQSIQRCLLQLAQSGSIQSFNPAAMPTYAILGATGSTGQCILNLLLQSPDNKVHAYVRSRAKLEKLSPKLAAHENVDIFSGSLTDIPLIADCIANTSAVFLTLGKNVSQPGMRVCQDAAHSVVAALCHIRAQGPNARLPKILMLSSAGINPRMNRRMSATGLKILHTGLSYAYQDLKQAQAYFELHKSWLDVIFIQPGGLANDVQKGHTLSTEMTQGFISYADLAAGMIEVAESEGNQYLWKGVAVVPASKDVKFNWEAPVNVVRGLFAYFLPSAYWACHSLGLVE